MEEFLFLRFDAPLQSFGDVAVDKHGFTAEMPGASLLAGLAANALGYRHQDAEALERLQTRLVFAVRRERTGAKLVDYQTVDLGQPFLESGWTTWGAPEGREGGSAKTGTHIRLRHYLADAVYSVALTLRPADEEPTLAALEQAFREPARPLFLGRKSCLPAAPIVRGRVSADSLAAALAAAAPLRPDRKPDAERRAWWPEGEEPPGLVGEVHRLPVADRRDWANRIHAGRRFLITGPFPAGPSPKAEP